MFKSMHSDTLITFKVNLLTYLCENKDLVYLADGNMLIPIKVISVDPKNLRYTIRLEEKNYFGIAKIYSGIVVDFLVGSQTDAFIIDSGTFTGNCTNEKDIPILMLDSKTDKIINKYLFFNEQFAFAYSLGMSFKEAFIIRMEKYQEELKNAK